MSVSAQRIKTSDLPAYELVGPPSAPVVIVLGGISAGRHIASWWDGVSGPGRALDSRRYRILGVEFLDGGSAIDGKPERIITTHDQADALAAVLDDLGIESVHAIIGASYGGMVALAFAERYRTRLQRLIVLGAAHEADPNTTATRVIQRRTVELGLATGRVRDALILARGLAMTTYRGEREFTERFSVTQGGVAELGQSDATFPVERYLRKAGERFATQFTAARFLSLSLSADLHRVVPESIHMPTTIVAFEGDRVVPRRQTLALAARLGTPLFDISHVDIATNFGHDGFLLETDAVNTVLSRALGKSATADKTDSASSIALPPTTHRTHTITQSIRSSTCLA